MNMSNSNAQMTFSPSMERSTLTAVFTDRAAARRAINDLKTFGLRVDQIGVAMRDRRQQDKLIADTGTHATEGAVSSAEDGGVLGALVGMQIPAAEARQRESGYSNASVLISAKVFEGVAEAQSIMQHNGGGLVNRAESPTGG